MDAILTKYDYFLIRAHALSRFRSKFPQYESICTLEGRTLVLQGYPHQIDAMIRASRLMLEEAQVILAALGLNIYCISSKRKVFGIELPIYERKESMLTTDTIETANGNIESTAVQEEVLAPQASSPASPARYISIAPLTEQLSWTESDLASQINSTILVDGIGYIAPASSVVDYLNDSINRLTGVRNQLADNVEVQQPVIASTSRGRRSKNSSERPYRPKLEKSFKGTNSDEATLLKAFYSSIPEDKWELVLDGILAEEMPKEIKQGFFSPLVKSRVNNRRPEDKVAEQMLAIARKLKEAGGIPVKGAEAAATDAA